ncbi:MAG: hypothetical protein Q4C23_03295 [Mycoplasmatota bacterium]|nr:hypothetical protein [Mycoplasmatota bacterium]
MKNTRSLVVSISTIKDLDKIKDDTKYINIDITNVDHSVINYFLLNGENYLYSELIEGNVGYIYVNHQEFSNAEKIIENIYANMPNDLSQIAISKYLYISLAKRVFFDINISSDKNEICNLSLISNINNLWGSLSLGRVTNFSISKIYYYLCKRMNLDVSIVTNEDQSRVLNKLQIDSQCLIVDLFSDIPYIQANMQTKKFATYNDDLELDKSIKYIKNKYNDYYLDKSLKNIDYTKEDCLKEVLYKTQKIIDINTIKPVELSIIYKLIFDKYCPNYDIKINNLYLNNKNKCHFIMISYNDSHYSYNYKQKTFVKVSDKEIMKNFELGKIGLYQNELIPNLKINMNV